MSTTSDVSARNLKPAPSAKKRRVRVWEHSRGVRQTVKQGWSWPAFIFGIFWFGYKKIWITTVMIAAGAAVVAGVALAAGASLDGEMGILLPIIALSHVVFGMFGNRIWERDLVERNYRSINRPPRTVQQPPEIDISNGANIGYGIGSNGDNGSIAFSPYAKSDSIQNERQSSSNNDLISGNSGNNNGAAIAEAGNSDKARPEATSLAQTHGHDSGGPVAISASPNPSQLNQQTQVRPESQPRVKIPTSKSTDQQPAQLTAMSMAELEALFGVTKAATVTPQAQPEANNLLTQGAMDAGADTEAKVDVQNDVNAINHPSNETVSMLGIETSTQIEKYETIAWMEITSGNVEPELWDAVTVESESEDSAQNNYVVRRVSQLQIQQGDVIEHNVEDNQISVGAGEATDSHDKAHSVQVNSDAEDIHSGFINGGEDYGSRVDSFAANGEAQVTGPPQTTGSPDTTISTAATPATDDESGLNFNHVKRVVIPASATDTHARTQSNHHDNQPTKPESTAQSHGNDGDRLGAEPTAVNPNTDSAHAGNGHANGTDQTSNGMERRRMAELSRDDKTSDVLAESPVNSAAVVSAIAGDIQNPATDNSVVNGAGGTTNKDSDKGASDRDRRRNALNFIQDHLQRLDEEQQEISTPELKRLLWSADCELIDQEDALKIRDWDGNLIPSASRSSISRTISYLIWTHYSDSREQL